jgi:hypothetical protein
VQETKAHNGLWSQLNKMKKKKKKKNVEYPNFITGENISFQLNCRQGLEKPRLTTVSIRCADHATRRNRRFGTNFAEKRRSLGMYGSLAG